MIRNDDGGQHQVIDHRRKSRRDVVIEPGSNAFAALFARFQRRIFSSLKTCYHFDAVAVERFLVARYAAEEGGHFRKHRDYSGPADHRQFAVTINLNEDFVGGDLVLLEFPGERFRPPAGAALVYSGTLSHAVEPVTSGSRFCMLSFLMARDGHQALQDYVKRFGAEYRTLRSD